MIDVGFTLPKIIGQFQYKMRPAGIYLLQVQVSTLKYNNLPPGEILFTLRIGKHSNSFSSGPFLPPNKFAVVLQMNVDSSALEAQRCSLSMNVNNGNDKRLLGMALISLPKDKDNISNSYKLTQSQDKSAEVQLKIKINPFDGSNSTPFNPQSKDQAVKQGNSSSLSKLKVKSKHSDDRSEENRRPRNYKVMEDDRVMEITQSEIRRFKAEKEAYYQMYQIQKSKNQVASKFISSVVKKLSEKYPNLIPSPPTSGLIAPPHDIRKKSSDNRNRNPADVSSIQQLQQANKSLHRQVDEYKKVVEQLKQQVAANAKPYEGDTSNQKPRKPTGFFDFGYVPPRQNSKQKSNIIPQNLKDNYETDIKKDLKDALAGIDLKKWLETSIGQRQAIQSKLSNSQSASPQRPQNKSVLVKKIKTGIDKAFIKLLGVKDVNRTALMSHKQQVNRILDDFISV